MEYTKLNKPGLVIKYSFLIFCLVFLIIGVAIFAAGIYLAVTGDTFQTLTGFSYVAGAAIIIVCGMLTVAIAIVGMVGCLGQWRIILLIFAGVVVVVVILELSAGIYGFVLRDELVVGSSSVRESFYNAIAQYRAPNDPEYDDTIYSAVNFVQDALDCCGVVDRSDWDNTAYYNLTGLYPNTCCSSQLSCGPLTSHDLDCLNATQTFISENAAAVGGVGVAFAVVETLGVALAIILCLWIHCSKKRAKGKGNKPQKMPKDTGDEEKL